MTPPTLLNAKWEMHEFFTVCRIRKPGRPYSIALVFHMHRDGTYKVSDHTGLVGWKEYDGLDLFTAQAVVDHIWQGAMTPRRVRFWRWLKNYFAR